VAFLENLVEVSYKNAFLGWLVEWSIFGKMSMASLVG